MSPGPLDGGLRLKLLEAPHAPEEREQFERWCDQTLIWAAPRLGLGIATALIVWWPLDLWVFAGLTHVIETFAYMRLTLAALFISTCLILPQVPLARKHPTRVAVPIAVLAAVVGSWFMSDAGTSDPFWFAYCYICPLFSLAFLQPLPSRALTASLLGGAGVIGFWLGPGDMFASAVMRSGLSYLAFCVLASIGMGHGLFLLVRSSYLMRIRVEEQREALRALTEGLEQRVDEQTEQLKVLHLRAQNAGAEQKRLLARDLHDGLGQELSSARLLVGVGRDMATEQNTRELFVELEDMVSRVQLNLRRVLQTLRPRLLDEQGLVEGLRTLLADTERRWGVACRLTLGALPDPLPPEASVAIFRVCQEALHNALRHAQASAIHVHLGLEGADLILLVEDNGRGMDPSAHQGHGLINIQERAQELGGEATWTGERGTRLCLRLPLERP